MYPIRQRYHLNCFPELEQEARWSSEREYAVVDGGVCVTGGSRSRPPLPRCPHTRRGWPRGRRHVPVLSPPRERRGHVEGEVGGVSVTNLRDWGHRVQFIILASAICTVWFWILMRASDGNRKELPGAVLKHLTSINSLTSVITLSVGFLIGGDGAFLFLTLLLLM